MLAEKSQKIDFLKWTLSLIEKKEINVKIIK